MKHYIFTVILISSTTAWSSSIEQENYNSHELIGTSEVSRSTNPITDVLDPSLEASLKGVIDSAEVFNQGDGHAILFEPNPVTWQNFDCVSSETINYITNDWGLIQGKVFYPAGDDCNNPQPPPIFRPVVLFYTGKGVHHWDYDYIAEHMAGIGLVVAVVNTREFSPTENCLAAHLICIEDRARIGITYLNNLKDSWQFANYVDFTNLVLMGHGEGGEAAVEAASMIALEEPLLGSDTSPAVKAVIALAPTDIGDGESNNRRKLLSTSSDQFLVLYGTRDEWIQGYPQFIIDQQPPETPFALYDRAGTEFSLDGRLFDSDDFIEKSMISIPYATHENFTDHPYGGGSNCKPVLTQQVQHLTTKGLVNGYLLSKIWGFGAYDKYFKGEVDWPWWTAASAYILGQYSAGEPGSRRVVDNFENGVFGTNTMGGNLTDAWYANAHLSSNSTSGRMVHGPQGGRRLHVHTGTPTALNTLLWTIPADKTDMSEFTHLSFRIGLGYDFEGSSRVTLRLKSLSTWSTILSSIDYGMITPVEGRNPNTAPAACNPAILDNIDQTVESMRTIRIPLEDFNLLDPSNINRVQIRFDHESTRDRSFYIDNVEFTK